LIQNRRHLIARVLDNGVDDTDVLFDEDDLALGLTLLIDVDVQGRTTFLYALPGEPAIAIAQSDVSLRNELSVGVGLANFEPVDGVPARVAVDNLRVLGTCP
jgi:hypothetical protein